MQEVEEEGRVVRYRRQNNIENNGSVKVEEEKEKDA